MNQTQDQPQDKQEGHTKWCKVWTIPFPFGIIYFKGQSPVDANRWQIYHPFNCFLRLWPLPITFYWKKVKVTQSCPTVCNHVDSTVYGILQARTLEWVAFPFSRGSSQLRDGTQVSRIAGSFFTSWATREAQEYWSG